MTGIKSLNEYSLDVYRCKATELIREGLLFLPDPLEDDVACPTAAAQPKGGPYTLPALATRLKWRPLSEAQQVYFAVRPQAGATAKVGCAKHEPGARVCSSSHYIYYICIFVSYTHVLIYLNGYMKRCRPGLGAPQDLRLGPYTIL